MSAEFKVDWKKGHDITQSWPDEKAKNNKQKSGAGS